MNCSEPLLQSALQAQSALQDWTAMLAQIRGATGVALTVGLADGVLDRFVPLSPELQGAIAEAHALFFNLPKDERDMLTRPEVEVSDYLRAGIVNFYSKDCGSPFIPLVAKGPWIITCYGRVVYEAGGYGMLGFGHNPDFLREAIGGEQVMSNVMTPSFAQRRIVATLKSRIGINRQSKCPYTDFLFMNSGSESMTVAGRITDAHAGKVVQVGGRYAGRSVKFAGLVGGFHGRTERPAQASDSSKRKYQKLASFKDIDNLWVVMPNDVDGLKALFERADKEGVFIEAFLLEPVMGEGNPGLAITPDFYKEARALTSAHDSFLIVDSIQAGLRAQGVLSIVDYPGFEGLEAPDIESFSKAINAGQYPLSVLGLNARAAGSYLENSYGNTMAANPRALEIGRVVLEHADRKLEQHIRESGKFFVEELEGLKTKFPKLVTRVQGTGLLVSVEFVDSVKVFGEGSLEEDLRIHGVNVIHGGINSLRFTPVFGIKREEIELIVDSVQQSLVRIAGSY
jgi:acetylornithine/succinyldiaminopimelate/putrescine aminotransferase